MAKVIICPNGKYAGFQGKVVFEDGVGLTDNEYTIQQFRGKGYGVEDETDYDGIVQTMTDPELKLFHAYNSYVDALFECVEEIHSIYGLKPELIGTVDYNKDAAYAELVRIAQTYLLVDDTPRFSPHSWVTSGNINHLSQLKNRKV